MVTFTKNQVDFLREKLSEADSEFSRIHSAGAPPPVLAATIEMGFREVKRFIENLPISDSCDLEDFQKERLLDPENYDPTTAMYSRVS